MGYSPESAAADLVDNSIAAGASQVRIAFEWGDAPRVVVADNGAGMSRDGLVEAMRVGSDPRDIRRPGDLGRFGLGLKTASLSQAQSLAVVTRTEGDITQAARWDLKRIEASAEWELEIGPPEDLGLTSDVLFAPTGTAVIWETLDRLLGDDGTIDLLYDTAESVARHLGMTFHRFIASGRTNLFVNDVAVEAWDPLAVASAEEVIYGELAPAGLPLRGCILPSPAKLEEPEVSRLAGPKDWLEQQGFYVYREDRLIVSGGWLGIGRASQPWRLDKKYNLARLSIDLDNSQDVAWSIDIRKSSAIPPAAVRASLYTFASRLRRRAVARSRAVAVSEMAATATAPIPIWVPRPDGGITYRLNRRHPLISRVRHAGTDRGALRSLLEAIERTAPLHGARLAATPVDTVALARQEQIEADLARLVRTLYPNMRIAAKLSAPDAKTRLMEHPPMREHEGFIDALIETLEKELKIDA